MLESAPDVTGRFQNAAANRDFDAIGQSFTEDASVEDEERTHRGRGEISAWQRKTRSKYDYTVTFVDGEPVGDSGYRVAAHLKGNFPGGEADVEYRFGIRHGLISSLRIT